MDFKTKFTLFALASMLLAAQWSTLAGQVHAANPSSFRPGNIISDSIFTDGSAMSAAEIQDFLEAKHSVCLVNFKTLSLHDADNNGYGDEPYGRGQDDKVLASKLIWQAAQIYNINPKVILVTLQKEQGLITRDDCPQWRYKTALGYGCPDSAPCNDAAYGFTRQIDYGVWHFRGFFDDNLQYVPYTPGEQRIYYHPDLNRCGGSIVNIQNRATASLYSYTPYQPNQASLNAGYGAGNSCSSYGNRNFWLYFTDWFGSTQGTFLLRTASSNTLWLKVEDKRYGIPSKDILYAYGVERTPVTVVSKTYLHSLENAGTLSTIFKHPGSATVYLADNGKKYGITSGSYCVRWGLSCSNAQTIEKSFTYRLANGGVLQTIAHYDGEYYLMQDGKRRLFLSKKAASDHGYSLRNSTPIESWTNKIRPNGYSIIENAAYAAFANTPTIYMYVNNTFYAFPDFGTYKDWSSQGVNVFYDNESAYTHNPPAPGGIVPQFIQVDTEKYVVSGGKKHNISAVHADWPATEAADYLATVVDKLKEGATFNAQSTVQTPPGAIYKIEDGKKKGFLSLSDYFALGYSSDNIIGLTVSSVSALSTGSALLPEGTLFKKPTGQAIYVVGSQNKAYLIGSMAQFYNFNFTASRVSRVGTATAEQYIYTTLHDTISDGASSYVVMDGEKYLLSDTTAEQWGISPSSKSLFNHAFIANLPTGNKEIGRFGKQEGSATIYYADGGKKRAITSYSKYESLGGNPGNTFTLPDGFIMAAPMGNPI